MGACAHGPPLPAICQRLKGHHRQGVQHDSFSYASRFLLLDPLGVQLCVICATVICGCGTPWKAIEAFRQQEMLCMLNNCFWVGLPDTWGICGAGVGCTDEAVSDEHV